MKKIVWLSSYPKSGNTYVRCFLSHYLFNSNSYFSFKSLNKIPKFESKQIFNKVMDPSDYSGKLNYFITDTLPEVFSCKKLVKLSF